jgi:class 3 adenylate cyclase
MLKKKRSNNRVHLIKQNKSEVTIDNLIKESKLSKILSELITKKVIILILAMLIIMPVISDDFYADDSTGCYNILANFLSNEKYVNTSELYSNFTDYFYKGSDDLYHYPIINITVDGDMLWGNITLHDTIYRTNEIKFGISKLGDVIVTFSIFDDSRLEAILNIIKTLFVCLMLTGAAVIFENDTSKLVLEPLEVMIEIVDNVAKDPMGAKNFERVQSGFKNTVSKLQGDKKSKREEQTEKYEVKIIQSAILKISALLAIGFGEAGGEIITANLSSYQDLNPMLSGKRKTAIFGFCDVRGFQSINEVLQEKIMMFVNEVADIVHSSVDRFGGAANKNIGDAFLMVWKFSSASDVRRDSQIDADFKRNTITAKYNRDCQTQADMAVLGYLKTIVRINKDNRILVYKDHPEIKERLPNYKVNMGFGLHVGWAFEGAVGSTYKMDASYLSPNVNMAARLEAATRQYGVTILISGQLHDFLSEEMKKICRHIDTVEVKGSKIPIRLYTIDVNLDMKPSRKHYKLKVPDRLKMYSEKKLKLWKEMEDIEISSVLYTKKTFRELLHTKRPRKFYKQFKAGMATYISGNWSKSQNYFTQCQVLAPSDKPTKVLLDYMKEFNYNSPKDWRGYRSLQSK